MLDAGDRAAAPRARAGGEACSAARGSRRPRLAANATHRPLDAVRHEQPDARALADAVGRRSGTASARLSSSSSAVRESRRSSVTTNGLVAAARRAHRRTSAGTVEALSCSSKQLLDRGAGRACRSTASALRPARARGSGAAPCTPTAARAARRAARRGRARSSALGQDDRGRRPGRARRRRCRARRSRDERR